MEIPCSSFIPTAQRIPSKFVANKNTLSPKSNKLHPGKLTCSNPQKWYIWKDEFPFFNWGGIFWFKSRGIFSGVYGVDQLSQGSRRPGTVELNKTQVQLWRWFDFFLVHGHFWGKCEKMPFAILPTSQATVRFFQKKHGKKVSFSLLCTFYLVKASNGFVVFPHLANDLHPGKLTWHWKTNHEWRCISIISYSIPGDFPASHVSFQGLKLEVEILPGWTFFLNFLFFLVANGQGKRGERLIIILTCENPPYPTWRIIPRSKSCYSLRIQTHA